MSERDDGIDEGLLECSYDRKRRIILVLAERNDRRIDWCRENEIDPKCTRTVSSSSDLRGYTAETACIVCLCSPFDMTHDGIKTVKIWNELDFLSSKGVHLWKKGIFW